MTHHHHRHSKHHEGKKHHMVVDANVSHAVTLPADALRTVNQILAAHATTKIEPTAHNKPLIVLDPGHGKFRYDPVAHPQTNAGRTLHDTQGAIFDDYGGVIKPKHVRHHADTPEIHEAPINLAIAKKLQAKLQAAGFDVLLTRNSADDILSSKYDAQLDVGDTRKVMHLAIHADIRPDAKPSGMVMYCSKYTKPGSPSAIFAVALGGGTGLDHYTDLLISPKLEQKHIPLALVEVGNMRNATELAYIMSDAGQECITNTLARRMVSYYQVTHPGKPLLPPFPSFPFTEASHMAFSPFLTPPVTIPAVRQK